MESFVLSAHALQAIATLPLCNLKGYSGVVCLMSVQSVVIVTLSNHLTVIKSCVHSFDWVALRNPTM